MCEFRGLIFWSGKIQFEWHIRYHLDVNPWSTVYFFLTIVSNRVKMPCREFWMMISFFRRCAIPSSISSDPHCGAASISARFSFVSCFLFFFVTWWWGSWNGGGEVTAQGRRPIFVPTTSWRASKFWKHLGEFFLFVSRVNFFFHRFFLFFVWRFPTALDSHIFHIFCLFLNCVGARNRVAFR